MTIDQLELGRRVFTNREFSGVPKGTEGTIVEASGSWPATESVAVQWNRKPGDSLRDWFAFDELEFLDLRPGGHELISGEPLRVSDDLAGTCNVCGISIRSPKR